MNEIEKIELFISCVLIMLYMLHLHITLKYKRALMNNLSLCIILIIILRNIYNHITNKERRVFLVIYIIGFIILFDIAYIRLNKFQMF
jgi:hypothetical protein